MKEGSNLSRPIQTLSPISANFRDGISHETSLRLCAGAWLSATEMLPFRSGLLKGFVWTSWAPAWTKDGLRTVKWADLSVNSRPPLSAQASPPLTDYARETTFRRTSSSAI